MKKLLILLLFLPLGLKAQDTTSIEMVYYYLDCQVKDSTVEALYNSHCLKKECGWIIHTEYNDILFLNDHREQFLRSIEVLYYKKIE